jgi:DNA repair photolyase
LEYASLGLTLYNDCSHKCKYCYVQCSGSYIEPRAEAALSNIEADLRQLAFDNNRDRVHLSFVGDPYDLGRQDCSYTRKVLALFKKYHHPFQILTKGGSRAFLDFDLYGKEDRFGVTLTFDNDDDSRKWEPGAALPADRIDALRIAHDHGISTWVSLEPVIDPLQTLHLIEMTHEYVDFYWVGKLNTKGKKLSHKLENIENAIDWGKFGADAVELMGKRGKEYGIKRALKEAV